MQLPHAGSACVCAVVCSNITPRFEHDTLLSAENRCGRRPAQVLQQVLQQVQAQAGSAIGGGSSDLALWETQGVLLLWLSILILTPFDLSTVDSAVGEDWAGGSLTPLAVTVMQLCQSYLDHPGGWGRANRGPSKRL